MKPFFCFFLILLLFVSFSLGFGISPGSQRVDYEKPGFENTYSYTILNDRDVPIEVTYEKYVELAEYVEVLTDEIEIGPKGSGSFRYKVSIPEDAVLKPGKNLCSFRIKDTTKEGGGMISVSLQVISNFVLNVPYPDYYPVGKLSATSVNEGKNVDYEISIKNKGENNITDASLNLEFAYENGEIIETETIDGVDIARMKEYHKKGTILAKKLSKGSHIGRAVLDYGAGSKEFNTTFFVGFYNVELANHSKYLFAEAITPLKFDIQSNWNGKIEDTYVVAEIDGKEYQSQTLTLDPFAEETFTAYVDDISFKAGQQKSADITIFYGEKQKSEQIILDVIKKQPEKDEPAEKADVSLEKQEPAQTGNSFLEFLTTPTAILAIIVLVLVIINMVILYRRDRNKR